MLSRIVRVTPQPNYRLEIEFEDGVSGVVDLSRELDGEMFEPLHDEAFFNQATVDEYGAVFWPNGADLAPDAIYVELAGQLRRNHKAEGQPAATAEAEPDS